MYKIEEQHMVTTFNGSRRGFPTREEAEAYVNDHKLRQPFVDLWKDNGINREADFFEFCLANKEELRNLLSTLPV